MSNRKIAYNTLVSSLGRVIGLAISLTTLGFVTRHLGQEGFGYYATILAFLYFFTILADLGLYSISVREISRDGADEKKIISNAFTLRLVVGLAFFVLAPLVGYFFPYIWQVKMGILIGAIGFWLMSNTQVLMGIFQKYLRTDKVAVAEVASRLSQLGLVILFVYQDRGLLAIVWAMAIGALVNFFLTYVFAQKYVRFGLSFDLAFYKVLLKESLPLALASIFTVIYFKLDTVMLSLMKPAADVGIYNLAYRFLESLLFFPAMFIGLLMPMLSKFALAQKTQFKQVSQNGFNMLVMFVIPMVIGTFFLSDKLVLLVGGPDFTASASVLNLLIIATGIIFMAILFSNMIIALKEQRKLTYIYALGAIINLATNFIFIPRYSYYGAAITTILTELVVTMLMVWVLARAVAGFVSLAGLFKYVLAGLIMVGILYLLVPYSLYLAILISVLIYFGFLYMIGAFSKQDIVSLIKKEA